MVYLRAMITTLTALAALTACVVADPAGTPPADTPLPAAVPTTTSTPIADAEPAAPIDGDTQPAAPHITRFTRDPAQLVQLGETVTLHWQAEGTRVELCDIFGAGPVNCRDVAPSGTVSIIADEQSLALVEYGLRVTTGETMAWEFVDARVRCDHLRPWFFEGAPARCAEAEAQRGAAAVQHFEHGRMIWTENPDRFYIFFDEAPAEAGGARLFEFFAAPYEFSEPIEVDETAPAQLLAPASGFGRLWRGELIVARELDLRTRLGWALAPERAFESAFQCETRTHPRGWSCYLLGPEGEVMRLYPDSTAQVRRFWTLYTLDQ